MEITYIREMEHNYMIVRPEGDAADYALKMLQAQPLQALVPFESRSINGVCFLYYRIDAMQSLENRSLAKKMNMEELRTLFEALRCAEQELREYLLGIDSLYLTPETVFIDRTSGAYRFVCMPFSSEGGGDLAALTEALTTLTDPADEEAAEAVYRLCACAQAQGTGLRDLQIWQQGKEETGQTYQADEPRHVQEVREAEARKEHRHEARRLRAEQMEEGIWYESDPYASREYPEEETGPAKKKPLSMSLLAFLFAVILLADIYIRKEYLLTPVGNILSLAVIGIAVAGLLGSLLCARRTRQRSEDDADAETKAEEKESAYRHSQAGLWDDLYEREEEEDAYEPAYEPVSGQTHEPAYKKQIYEPAYDTGTVFLAPKKHTRTSKLYGRDNTHNCHVPLERLPLTLGKLAGHVDFLLRDESVSRIHAHISKNESGQVCIRDLNSTNGTFLNGIRLVPNETVSIREGDEVCFGDMVFEYL